MAKELAGLETKLEPGWQNELVITEQVDRITKEPILRVHRHYLQPYSKVAAGKPIDKRPTRVATVPTISGTQYDRFSKSRPKDV